MKIKIAITIDREIHEKLKKIAVDADRSVSYLINQCCKEALKKEKR